MERSNKGIFIRRYLAAALTALVVVGCAEEEALETATKGYLSVSSAETAFPYTERSAIAFTSVYKKSYVDVKRSTSREALVALSEGETRVAVLSRELNQFEQEDMKDIAELNGKTFQYRTIAHDAVTIIVHGDNPVEKLTFRQLKDIYTGKITNWKDLGGENRRIRPLVRDRNAGTYEVFQDRVLDKAKYGANAYPCSTVAELTRIVEYDKGAIGCAGLMMIQRGYLKAIAIAEEDDGAYVVPSQRSIHDKRYPLSRPVVVCYFRTRAMDLVKGFVTYLMEAKGQTLAMREGILPATMPVRIVEMKR